MSDLAPGAFDPAAVIRAFDEHDVRYVIVGGVAARLHGSPTLTEDIDVTPERSADNLRRLAAALQDLDARLAVPDVEGGLAVPLDQDTFSSPVMNFTTTAGEIDVVLEPTGVGGFDQLHPRAVDFEIFGIRLRVAALDDIIASKEASGRLKDRAQLGVLHELADELSRRDQEQDRHRGKGRGRRR